MRAPLSVRAPPRSCRAGPGLRAVIVDPTALTLIPDDVLDQIRQATDLVDLIGRTVPLRKAGRSWAGRCPFHQEKTPSFHVWQETGTWKCFGCQKGGNCFHYVMEREGLPFPEVVRQLATAAGISIGPEDPQERGRASRTARLREVTEWACRHFEGALRSAAGERARDYFKRRGVTGETAQKFRLGYAPPGWDVLLRAGGAAGFSEAELDNAGLILPRKQGDGHYDRFRDRVVFPICDAQGRPIAFGARTLGDDEPKYLNSPETPLFTKGRHLYGLHLAKEAMMRTGDGAIMEGYTDVLMAHQQGWPVAVAGLGTALTREQAALLSRFVKRLWLVYDGDTAGQRAAERAVPAFLPESIDARVALLPKGQDPFDLLRAGGIEAIQMVLEDSRPAFAHWLSARKAAHDATTPAGQERVLDDVVPLFETITNPATRETYMRQLVEALPQLDPRTTWDFVRNEARRRAASAAAQKRSAPPMNGGSREEEGSHGPAIYDFEAGSRPRPEERRPPAPPPPPVESHLVVALLGCPRILDEFRERLGPEALGHVHCRALVEALLDAAEAGPLEPVGVVARLQEPELASFAAGLLAEAREPGLDLERGGLDCIERLVRAREQSRLTEARESAADAEAENEAWRRLQDLHRRRAQGGSQGGDRPTG